MLRAEPICNTGFKGNVVPFAPSSEERQEIDEIALKKFTRAHKVRMVTGPPILLLTIKIPSDSLVDHILRKEIKVLDDRPEPTVGFTRPVNVTNFPTMEPEVTMIEDPWLGDELLSAGYMLMQWNRAEGNNWGFP